MLRRSAGSERCHACAEDCRKSVAKARSCDYIPLAITSAFIATDAALDATCDQERLQADENSVASAVRAACAMEGVLRMRDTNDARCGADLADCSTTATMPKPSCSGRAACVYPALVDLSGEMDSTSHVRIEFQARCENPM